MAVPFKAATPQTRFDLDRLAREAVDTLPPDLRTDPPAMVLNSQCGPKVYAQYVAGTGRLTLICPVCGNLVATIAVAALDLTEGGTSDV